MLPIRNLVVISLRNLEKTRFWASSLCFSTFTPPLYIRATPMLMAEPMKKRKKADPAMMKLREEKKRKRLWRDIKRLTKNQKQLKPLDEIQVPYTLVDEPKKYHREAVTLTEEEIDRRLELRQQWCIYKMKRHAHDLQMIERIDIAQDKALDELRKESPFLYEEALKVDYTFLPFMADGPTVTPPIKDYDIPDGEYKDCTRTWEPVVIPEMDKKLKKQLSDARKAGAAKNEKK